MLLFGIFRVFSDFIGFGFIVVFGRLLLAELGHLLTEFLSSLELICLCSLVLRGTTRMLSTGRANLSEFAHSDDLSV